MAWALDGAFYNKCYYCEERLEDTILYPLETNEAYHIECWKKDYAERKEELEPRLSNTGPSASTVPSS